MSQESTGIHWLLSDTNFILSSTIYNAFFLAQLASFRISCLCSLTYPGSFQFFINTYYILAQVCNLWMIVTKLRKYICKCCILA